MRVIVAFDSFKGCISAAEACAAAREGVLSSHPDAEVLTLPLSDGGEGFVDCISAAVPVVRRSLPVHGPLMEPVIAEYAVSSDGRTAYLEVASACGLTLVPQGKRNPELTSTYGVGEMIADACRQGCRRIFIGLGGSATCDGGEGIARCLSGSFDDKVEVFAVCDVKAPLYGPHGAAYVFGPQKGATPEQVVRLDERLRQFARRTEASGIASADLAMAEGAGAAGGTGYALMAYLGASFCSGIDTVLDLISFDSLLAGTDMVLTGEGCSDAQTLMGKVPFGVLARARAAGVPVHLMSGCIKEAGILKNAGFASVRSINEGDARPVDVLMRPEVAKSNLALCAGLLD